MQYSHNSPEHFDNLLDDISDIVHHSTFSEHQQSITFCDKINFN